MKKSISTIALLFLVTLFFSCSESKRITILQTPPKDNEINQGVNLSEMEKKYSKYDGIYLNIKNIYEHSATKGNPFFSAGTKWLYHRIFSEKYLILNPDNQKLTTIQIQLHDKAEVNNFYLISLSSEGVIKRFSFKDLVLDNDQDTYKTYKFSIPDVKKGTIVELGYDLTYNSIQVRPPIEYEIELQYDLPCEKLEIEFDYPDWWKIKTKKLSEIEEVQYSKTHDIENKKSKINYKAENIPALTPEPFAPYFKEVAKYLRINFTMIDLSTPIELFQNWKDVAEEYRDYAMNKETFLTAKVGNVTDEIIGDTKKPIEKMEKIVSYLQKEIMVSKDGKDRSFAKVLTEKQGNIFEICGLAESMLSKVDLDCDYLIIHTASTGYFDKDFVSYDQFEVPAVKVHVENKDYVVIPYYKYLPIDYIPVELQEQPALVVSDNKNKNGTFWTLPVGKMSDNNFTETYDINIIESGILNVKEEKIIEGDFAYQIREYLEDLNETEKDKKIKELLTYSDGDVGKINYEIINKEDPGLPLIIRLKYNISNLVTITPEEIIFQTGGLLSPSSQLKQRLDPNERVNPIVIHNDQLYKKKISITYPVDWEIIKQQPYFSFENEFGSIEGKYSYSEGNIQIEQKSFLKKSKKPKEKIFDLLNITGNKTQLEVPTFIFNNKL